MRADAVKSRSGRRDTVSRTAKLRRPTQTPGAPRPLSSHSTRRTPLIDRRPLCPLAVLLSRVHTFDYRDDRNIQQMLNQAREIKRIKF